MGEEFKYHRTVFVNHYVTEVWGSEIWCSTIKPCWVNGYGVTPQKRKLYGVKLWNSSTVDCGGAGVPTLYLVRMGRVYGSSLERAGLNLLIMCTLRWGMGLRLIFGNISGVARHHWEGEFQNCINLHVIMKLRWRIWHRLMAQAFNGISVLPTWYRTGSWNLLLTSWMSFIRRFQLGVRDTICWKPLLQEGFSVNSFYKSLLSPECREYPWKAVWQPRVPSKVNFFIWTASLGKVLTIDNLRKCRLVIMDWCCMCKEAGESIDYLFHHCHTARELWALVFSMFGIWWVMPRHVVDLLAYWNFCKRRSRSATAWGLIPNCLMWVIWRERNARSFGDLEKTIQKLKQFFLFMLLEWVNASDIAHFNSLYELINFCQLSL